MIYLAAIFLIMMSGRSLSPHPSPAVSASPLAYGTSPPKSPFLKEITPIGVILYRRRPIRTTRAVSLCWRQFSALRMMMYQTRFSLPAVLGSTSSGTYRPRATKIPAPLFSFRPLNRSSGGLRSSADGLSDYSSPPDPDLRLISS